MKVFLANRGNIDHGEDPDQPKYGTSSDFFTKVTHIEAAVLAVRNYIAKYDLGSGNWAGGQVVSLGKIIGSISYNGKYWDKDHKYFSPMPEIIEEEFLRAQIEQVRDLYTEKRSDVEEILSAILECEEWDESWVEGRYVRSPIPEGATEVFYDTLTTHVEFLVDDEVITPCNEIYTDDED